MIKVGITGQSGFIGTHLFNTLGLYSERFERIPFEDTFFSNQDKLLSFVRKCDFIVHLAAVNRHENSEVIYKTNIRLVQQLISACEATKSKPHVLFSSSTQEESDNDYGKSKKAGRELFNQWAKRNNAKFTGFVIPNVYGPFGNPYYNSVVATFCHQLTHKEQPKILEDIVVKLIYVNELVEQIISHIALTHGKSNEDNIFEKLLIIPSVEIKVSNLLIKLEDFGNEYLINGIIPDLNDNFTRNLFNTFISYIDHSNFFPFSLKLNTDSRGIFAEMLRLNSGGQVSFSTTVPGITRGNHFHTRKAERFLVIKGKARIDFRRIGTERIISFELDGSQPSFVDMPIWYTHNITNIGKEDLYTIFWINEFYDPTNPDTYFNNV
jgi:UDP-2-acetamido-2,6-beta-L-arabino-hexul-4-ose reductase